jgi:dTMP kinase
MTQAIAPMIPQSPMNDSQARVQERLQKLLQPESTKSQSRGRLITLEGPERSGKTTQIQKLRQWLESTLSGQRLLEALGAKEIVLTREPGATPLGQGIRHLLLHEEGMRVDRLAELLLFCADRAQHYADVIKPALQKGHLVICDRYIHSTIAYQGAGRRLNPKLVSQLAGIACEYTYPDLTFFLDISPQTVAQRSLASSKLPDRIEGESLEFHYQVQQRFIQLAQSTAYGVLIDAERTVGVVQAEIRDCFYEQVKDWVGLEKIEGAVRNRRAKADVDL